MNKINFQNGTLVSKAKVTINDTVYEVEPAEYEGTTPLNAENLNQMQDNIIQGIYPIGSIYMSTASTNPSTLFGFGTWQLWGAGKVPVGIDTEDEDFNVVEKTGGEKTHTLTIDELPSHNHGGVPEANWNISSSATGTGIIIHNYDGTESKNTSNTGNSQAHNNLQPYITCYMWKRTA